MNKKILIETAIKITNDLDVLSMPSRPTTTDETKVVITDPEILKK